MRHDYNVTRQDYTVKQHDYNVKRHDYNVKRHDYNDKRNDYKYSKCIDVMLYAFLSDMNIMLCGIIILLSGMWGGGEDLAN